ncbi:hypothetical protein Q2T71_04610 [Yersinia sp. 1652 StPb PI]
MQKIGDIPNTRADINGEFTDGNVAGGVPPTILPAEWFNTIQRELISVLSAAGITPDSNKFDQVATAVSKLATLGLTGIGIGLQTQPAIVNFDFQNFTFTSGANYLASTVNWLNAPSGVTYPSGLTVSITVNYIANSSNYICFTLKPHTVTNSNYRVYEVISVGAAGSRVFTVREAWNSANPVPISGGGTGATAAAGALANLGGIGLSQLTGVVGTSRNAKMSVTAASATATFTADELIVQTALGGLQYKLSSFNKTINLANTGVGGMDTGTAPATGFVTLYAIYNPTTQVSALLAVNATSVLAPEVYGGANMPSGYTASALVSVWRTASSQFTVGYQLDRSISFPRITVLTTTTGTTPLLPINMPNYLPINAKYCSVDGALGTSTNGVVGMGFSSSLSGIAWRASAMTTTAGYGSTYTAMNIPVITAQTIYYSANATLGTLTNFASSLVDYAF